MVVAAVARARVQPFPFAIGFGTVPHGNRKAEAYRNRVMARTNTGGFVPRVVNAPGRQPMTERKLGKPVTGIAPRLNRAGMCAVAFIAS